MNKRCYIKIELYNSTTFNSFKKIKIISTHSYKISIDLIGMRLVVKRLGTSTPIIACSRGYITIHEALRTRTGGVLIGFII